MQANAPHHVLVIANPVSGQGRGEEMARELTAALEGRGVNADLYLTRGSGDAQEAAREVDEGVDLVVSVGGDGTLREVLTGLRKRPAQASCPPVGVLPMGTGNALGVDLGLPREVNSVLEMLLACRTVDIDIADVNGELSFLLTGVGPDALVVNEVDRRRKGKRLTKWAYVPAGIRMFLNYRHRPLKVTMDGEDLPGSYSQVMASNLIHYGGLIKLSPERVLDDGKFEVFLFRGTGRLSLLLYTLRFFLGRIPGGPVQMRRAARLRITSAEPVPYHVDGDPMGQTPVEIEVTGTRFKLVVP